MRKPMKIIAIVAVAAIAGGGWWYYGQAEKKSAEAAVKVEDVVIGTIEETVTAQGTIEPKDSLDVGTQVSGQLKKLYVDVGVTVKTGDPLAEIDPRVYESRLAADEASLKVLRAQYADAKATLVLAQQKHDRNLALQKSKFVSVSTIEETAASLDKAKAGIDSLNAQIEKMQSTLEEDKLNLGYTHISAPRDGVVVDIPVKEGQTLNASQTSPTVMTLADLDTMTVWAQVSEADVMKLHEGMEVSFSTLGNATQKRKGRVRQIMPTPEVVSEVVLYNVLIDVDNKDRNLMNGMSAQVFFSVAKAEKVPLVPFAALGRRVESADRDGGEAYVVKVWSNGTETERTVLIGLSNRSKAEVKAGLVPGEKVVIGTNKQAETPASSGDSEKTGDSGNTQKTNGSRQGAGGSPPMMMGGVR